MVTIFGVGNYLRQFSILGKAPGHQRGIENFGDHWQNVREAGLDNTHMDLIILRRLIGGHTFNDFLYSSRRDVLKRELRGDFFLRRCGGRYLL